MKIDNNTFMEGNERVWVEWVDVPKCPKHVRVRFESEYDCDYPGLGRDHITLFFDTKDAWNEFVARLLAADAAMRA